MEETLMKLLEKLKTTPQGWSTNPKERMSYYLYFCGQNVIYNLVAMYLTTYTMFKFQNYAKVAAVVLVVKVWDAVNDAIFGYIFDKVKFKSGKKYVPWLKISSVFIPITTVLLFAIPNSSSETFGLAWLAIAYVLWDTAYTLCDAPIFGIVTAMSKNLDERKSLISYKSIWSGVGSGISLVLGTVLVSQNVGGSYFLVAIICAVVAFIAFVPACFKLEERYVPEVDEEFTVKRMLSYLFSNKYLLLFYIGYFFYSAANVSGSLTLVTSYFLFKNENFGLIVQVIGVLPSLIFALLVPTFLRKIEKMTLFKWSTLATLVLSVVIWLAGFNNIIVFTILFTLRSIPLSIIGVMLFMFTPDCAEYGRFVTGIEAKGITFSIQTFMAKLTAAVSGTLGMFILGLKFVGWNPLVKPDGTSIENFADIAAAGITQSPHALNVLWFVFIMVPAIGCGIAYIIWSFYKLPDKDVQIMIDANNGDITREDALSRLSREYK